MVDAAHARALQLAIRGARTCTRWPIESPREQSGSFSANLYLLVAGLLVGLLLGPFVLGRASPETYYAVFGAGQEHEALLAFEERAADELARVQRIGVSGEYLPEKQAQLDAERIPLLEARRDALESTIYPYMTAVLLALVAIMAIEALYARPQSPVGLRIATMRYALATVWLVLLLAVPNVLMSVSLVFVALLILVALLAGLIPLGVRR